MIEILQDGLAIGSMREEESGQILDLINTIQPHVPWSPERFRWQYRENPAGPARVWVARDGDRVVSLYVAVVHTMQLGRSFGEGWMVQDVMTHPEYRGKGLLHLLADVCLTELRDSSAIGYAFPNNQSERSFIRRGWHNWGPVPWWSRPVGKSERGLEPRPCTMFDASVSRIWEESGLPFGVRRDAAYLEWRYRKPGQAYQRFVLDDRAALVVKFYDAGETRRVHVCDCFAADDSLVAEMLRFANRWALERGASVLTAWMPPSHRYARQLEATGFVADSAPSRMVVVTAPPAVGALVHEPSNWYLAQGDSDVY